MKEEWKEIDGYDGFYEVSNKGRVRSYKCKGPGNKKSTCPRLLTLKTEELGYKRITLFDQGDRTIHSVHRLVAKAFIPNPKNKPQINHLDSNPSNNNVDNLEWSTQSENIKYAFDNGRKGVYKGEKCNSSKLSRKEVLEIRKKAKKRGKYYDQRGMAMKYNVSGTTISNIVNRESWDHV